MRPGSHCSPGEKEGDVEAEKDPGVSADTVEEGLTKRKGKKGGNL